MTWQVIEGDCVEVMAGMPACSVDAVVCDPPYGLEFMGKDWDSLNAAKNGNRALHPTGEANYRDDGRDSVGGRLSRTAAPPTPKKNPRCRKCGKGKWNHDASRCHCEQPDWDTRTAEYGRDMQAWHEAWAREALRVLKPGGHLLAFGGTRTYHRLACAIEDAGFEIRDTIAWMYGSGFPKSLDVGKQIDKTAGAEREVVGVSPRHAGRAFDEGKGWNDNDLADADVPLTVPATPDAERWDGWGTALKPAHEPIVVARKPLSGTVAQTVLEHGTGALNVDGCRIEGSAGDGHWVRNGEFGTNGIYGQGGEAGEDFGSTNPKGGRWPANVVLAHTDECRPVGTRKVKNRGGVPDGESAKNVSPAFTSEDRTSTVHHFDANGTETVTAWECHPECPVRLLDEQTGERPSSGVYEGDGSRRSAGNGATGFPQASEKNRPNTMFADSGGASRFFYCAKTSSAERNAGLDGFEEREKRDTYGDGLQGPRPHTADDYEWQRKGARNSHPTVKPIDLMRWLVRLVTPPGGTILDPFTGSGTTGAAAVLEGFNFVGIERDPDYIEIAKARIAWWAEHPEGMKLVKRLEADLERKVKTDAGQLVFDVNTTRKDAA